MSSGVRADYRRICMRLVSFSFGRALNSLLFRRGVRVNRFKDALRDRDFRNPDNWAMAATYDGLAASFLVWGVVLMPIQFMGSTLLEARRAFVAMAVAIAAAILCLKEGGKHYGFQVEDLIAALSVQQSSERVELALRNEPLH